jgi:aminoglycoside phosphotransferase family enzyme/predicted kinase
VDAETRAAVAETHVSTVFFVGDRAYKLKKPVALGFLDYSTREAREAACHREVELNRRLAPDVYLGVADVFGPDGTRCDHLVVMRRMPTSRRLSALVEQGLATEAMIGAVARQVSVFHANALADEEMSRVATRDAVRANWRQSFEQMRPFVPAMLDADTTRRAEELVEAYLAGRAPLFEARIADERVRDGHGDLLADDIFMLDDGPRILDCLEFDDRLRFGDVLNDVAFLAMDLEFHGSPALAGALMERWRELTGETHPASLAHHYIAYRAHGRAKVACLRAAQGDAAAVADARTHLDLTLAHLEHARVAMVLVGGLPGTGKSTLAEGIARTRGWAVLHSDEIRKELSGLPAEAHADAGFGEGIYSRQYTERTYAELLRRAERMASMGESVVVDASWTGAASREAAVRVAQRTHTELHQFRCESPRDVAAYRLSTRGARYGSDATPAIAVAMHEVADDWRDAVRVDTDRPPADVLASVLQQVPGAPAM